MLEQIDLDRQLGKSEYRERRNELRDRLQNVMQGVLEAHLPVAVIIEGWAGTAKVQTIAVMTRRLDPRGLRVHPITPPRTYEKQFPWLHRFWRLIPSYGRIAFFDRSWYREVLAARVRYGLEPHQFRDRCEDMAIFERQLVDDGAVLLKFWLHISKKEQRRRFQRLLSNRLTAWQVTDEDRWQHRNYEKVAATVEDAMARTSTPTAPWMAIPASCTRYARIAVMESVVMTLEQRLGITVPPDTSHSDDDHFDHGGGAYRRVKVEATGTRRSDHAEPRSNGVAEHAMVATIAPIVSPIVAPGILRTVDLSLRADEKSYSSQLAELQAYMHLLGFEIYRQQRPIVLVFEGWDAAGKGSGRRRQDPPLSVSILAPAPATWPDGDFRPFVVWPGACRTG
ncbi:MAG TPA: hypothetical protein PKA05_01880 [Roseiflexaceae bacterium]|nr:hypothetical protein [Roseiflexaceae bacterium]